LGGIPAQNGGDELLVLWGEFEGNGGVVGGSVSVLGEESEY